jgi:obg-like ATPase 1
MPPKKAVVEEKIPLGRPGNNLKSGIVWPDLPLQALYSC